MTKYYVDKRPMALRSICKRESNKSTFSMVESENKTKNL